MNQQIALVSPSTRPLSPAEISTQLDRMLGSEIFSGSPRMQEFLRYLIAETQQDEKPRLKEFSIGVAVFGRDESFDPRIDSVVRVEAGRLRAKIRDYYAGPGKEDPVLISVPKGGYSPAFDRREDGDARRRTSSGLSKRARGYAGVAVASAGVLLSAWLWLAASEEPAPGAPVPQSVAVLPLSDFTGNTDDYFSEAMTDVLIAELSEYRDLRVTSLGSVMHYRDPGLDPAEIAAQLGVGSVVAGTVFRDSGSVRITANLIDARSGRNLWSESYTRPMTGIIALQEEVASAIATQLAGQLLAPAQPTERLIEPAAYDAYLKGTYWRNRLTAEGYNRGILFLQQAVALQPDYAEAWSAMAACHCRLAGHGIEVVPPDLALREASRMAAHALELDDSLAEPNAVMGIIKFKFEWDARAAEEYLERALARNPSLFEAHLWFSEVAEGTGRHELAVEHARQARELNPLSQAANLNLGWQLYQAGLPEEAGQRFDALIEFDPEFWGGYWGRGHVLRSHAAYDEAIEAFARAVSLEGGHTLPLAALGHTYAVSGRRSDALAIIDRLVAMSGETYVSPMHIAEVYAGLGDTDQAFDWLHRALEVRARSMAWLTVRREFDALRGDPRYAALVDAVGIARRDDTV